MELRQERRDRDFAGRELFQAVDAPEQRTLAAAAPSQDLACRSQVRSGAALGLAAIA